MAAIDDQRRAAGLTPLPNAAHAEAKLERGHARGTIQLHVEPQSRIPIIGLDAGCIPGTRPGCSARELERAGRDLVRSRLHRNRFKPA